MSEFEKKYIYYYFYRFCNNKKRAEQLAWLKLTTQRIYHKLVAADWFFKKKKLQSIILHLFLRQIVLVTVYTSYKQSPPRFKVVGGDFLFHDAAPASPLLSPPLTSPSAGLGSSSSPLMSTCLVWLFDWSTPSRAAEILRQLGVPTVCS